jgi:hypothetical protein
LPFYLCLAIFLVLCRLFVNLSAIHMNFDSGHESHRRTVAINIVVDKIQFQTRCENMTDCGSCAYFLDEEDAIIW